MKQGFEKKEQVIRYQRATVDFFRGKGGEKNTQKELIDSLLKEEINRLETLYEALVASEKNLLKTFGLDTIGNLKADNSVQILTDHINKAVSEWKKCNADQLLNIDIDNNLMNFLSMKKQENDLEYINDQLNSLLSNLISNQQALNLSVQNNDQKLINFYTAIIKAFNVEIENLSFSTQAHFTTARGFVNSLSNNKGPTFSPKKGILRFVDIQATLKNPNNLKIAFNNNLPIEYRNRLLQIIQKAQKASSISINGKIVKDIKEYFFIQGSNRIITGEAQYYINQELNRINSYALSRNWNVIKGFLGEVYWNSLLSYIGKKGGNFTSIPIGDIKNNFKESLPIDIILESIGFQVKNYKINNLSEPITFKKSMTLNGFIDRRLEMSSKPLNNFFLSWGYNKVYNSPHALEVYSGIFNNFEKSIDQFGTNLKSLAERRLDRMIKLDSDFTSTIDKKLTAIEGTSIKFNTIYFFNKKPVFSSEIVKNMINHLSNGEAAKIYLSGFDFTPIEPRTAQVWPKSDNTSADRVNTSRVSYEITMDLSQF